jgi:zinc transport system substrate-binding protein
LFHSFFFTALLFLSSVLSAELVLVSVAPHKFFVDQIAQHSVPVQLMVPAGASSHTYEPSPKEVLTASKADLWFTIGEGFEPKVIRTLTSYNPSMNIVDLRKGVRLIRDGEHHHQACSCHSNSEDVHYWLSLREAETQARTIYEALSQRYPEKKELFKQGYEQFISKLRAEDAAITDLLKPVAGRSILVSHPAYAYFVRDYNMDQISIEFEGKDPTPLQLTTVLRDARNKRVTKVYVQPQYPSKGATLVAKEIGATVVSLDPYSEKYFETMREIAKEFATP